MTKTNKKVSFYHITFEKRLDDFTKTKALDNDEIEKIFNRICLSCMRNLGNGRKAVNIQCSTGKYIIEIIEFSAHRAYIKIGQQNQSNTVALRDVNTLESENVPMSATQLLELFTYCFIDFETCIVSYIGINGAPRISALKGLFETNISPDDLIEVKFTSILSNDIIERLSNKNVISKITITFAVPPDTILSDKLGVSENDFDKFRNIDSSTATYVLKTHWKKSLLGSENKLTGLVDTIKSRFGDKLIKLNVNAQDDDKKSQSYDLLQYLFTKTVMLKTEDDSVLNEDSFKVALLETYFSSKHDLLRYIRIN